MSDNDTALFTDTDDNQDQANENANTSQDTSTENPFADLLSGITNEDGTQKYTDVANALTSIPHAQTHINTIESDNAELKDKLAEALAAQELLRKSVSKQPEQKPLSQEALLQAIDGVLDAKSEKALKASNLDSVGKIFSDTYGDKAKDELKALAVANGVGLDFIKQLSETSPKVVLKLAGLSDTAVRRSEKSSGTVNTETFSSKPPAQENKSVMGASNTSDLITGWRAAGETVKRNLA
ncbi:MAG: hypothetical protein V3S69_04955 [Dehalococcoidales bacterium]